MNRFRQFMNGRYGVDNFSRFLIYASVIITLIGTITRINVLVTLAYIPLVYSLYRIFSKDINKRIQENYKYFTIRDRYKHKYDQFIARVKGTKNYRYYTCPSCKQKIRVPKGKGKICITCPKCRAEFIKRT